MPPAFIKWTDLSTAEIEPIIKKIATGKLTIGDETDKAFEPFQEDAINKDGVRAYVAKYGAVSDLNANMMIEYCRDADVPCVVHNLELAQRELQSMGLWFYNTEPEPEAPKPAEILTRPMQGGLAAAPPTAEEAKLFEKVKDDPTLTDHTRKKRFEELKRAAIASRFANKQSTPKPTIVI